MVLSLLPMIGAVLVMIAVGAAGVGLMRRYAGFALGLAIAGAAGTWLSLMGLAVLWMADRLIGPLIVPLALAAIVSAVFSVNAGCWWLSVRAGLVATGATALVATILFIILFVPFVSGEPAFDAILSPPATGSGWITTGILAAVAIGSLVLAVARQGLVDLETVGGWGLPGWAAIGIVAAIVIAVVLALGGVGALWMAIALGAIVAVLALASVFGHVLDL